MWQEFWAKINRFKTKESTSLSENSAKIQKQSENI